MATSPLLSQGPHSGEGPTWLHHPCLLGVPMVGIDRYGYITPAFLGVPMVGKDQNGYITPAFSGIPNTETKSEVATQILPSWGLGKCQKKLSILSTNTCRTSFTSHFKSSFEGTKIFQRPWRWPISPYWLVLWSGPLKHFRPLEKEGAGGLGCWGQGPHLGAPRIKNSPVCHYHGASTGRAHRPRLQDQGTTTETAPG